MTTLTVDLVTERLAAYRATRIEGDEYQRAAVAAILRDSDAGAEALFIQRARDERDPWSGHMAFPGGHVEPGDAGLHAAAERETLEELSIDLPSAATHIGCLDDLQAWAGGRAIPLLVRPHVYRLHAPVEIRPNEEVEDTVWIPLTPLLRGDHDGKIPWKYGDVMLPCYQVQEHTIWGLTYRMLSNLWEVVGPLR